MPVIVGETSSTSMPTSLPYTVLFWIDWFEKRALMPVSLLNTLLVSTVPDTLMPVMLLLTMVFDAFMEPLSAGPLWMFVTASPFTLTPVEDVMP